MADYPNLVQALLQPRAYRLEGVIPDGVELVETHVSYLFLTGERVYKVKKAVNLGFLDFTDLETRRRFCHEEVAVNQRFSPGVYQGVVTVNRTGGGVDAVTARRLIYEVFAHTLAA
jgi:aminoglycoside phosphotransferase family enzyme